MELYKWYKGTELPDIKEYGYMDCLIIFRHYGYPEMCVGRFTEAGRGMGMGTVPFWYGRLPQISEIKQEDIISYLPIEFPKEVS